MSEEKVFCRKCGAEIKSSDVFCSKCGIQLERSSEVLTKDNKPKSFFVSKGQMNVIIGILLCIFAIFLIGFTTSSNSNIQTEYTAPSTADSINSGSENPSVNPDKTSATVDTSSQGTRLPQNTMSSLKTYAYVSSSDANAVYVIDTATNKVIATIPVGESPSEVAVSPDGSKVYVSNFNSNVSVIDTKTNSVTDTLAINTIAYKDKMSFSPDGTKLFVLNLIGDISVVDTSTNVIFDVIPREMKSYNALPLNIAISPDGTKLYVLNVNSNSVSIIDTASKKDIYDIFVGKELEGGVLEIAVSPDGKKIYVPYIVFRQSAIAVIDTATYTVTKPISIDFVPGDVAVSPDGTKLYASDRFGNSVNVYDTATYGLIRKIIGIDQPDNVAFTPDGTKIYVTDVKTNTVCAINETSNTVTDRIPVGTNSSAIAIGEIRTT